MRDHCILGSCASIGPCSQLVEATCLPSRLIWDPHFRDAWSGDSGDNDLGARDAGEDEAGRKGWHDFLAALGLQVSTVGLWERRTPPVTVGLVERS